MEQDILDMLEQEDEQRKAEDREPIAEIEAEYNPQTRIIDLLSQFGLEKKLNLENSINSILFNDSVLGSRKKIVYNLVSHEFSLFNGLNGPLPLNFLSEILQFTMKDIAVENPGSIEEKEKDAVKTESQDKIWKCLPPSTNNLVLAAEVHKKIRHFGKRLKSASSSYDLAYMVLVSGLQEKLSEQKKEQVTKLVNNYYPFNEIAAYCFLARTHLNFPYDPLRAYEVEKLRKEHKKKKVKDSLDSEFSDLENLAQRVNISSEINGLREKLKSEFGISVYLINPDINYQAFVSETEKILENAKSPEKKSIWEKIFGINSAPKKGDKVINIRAGSDNHKYHYEGCIHDMPLFNIGTLNHIEGNRYVVNGNYRKNGTTESFHWNFHKSEIKKLDENACTDNIFIDFEGTDIPALDIGKIKEIINDYVKEDTAKKAAEEFRTRAGNCIAKLKEAGYMPHEISKIFERNLTGPSIKSLEQISEYKEIKEQGNEYKTERTAIADSCKKRKTKLKENFSGLEKEAIKEIETCFPYISIKTREITDSSGLSSLFSDLEKYIEARSYSVKKRVPAEIEIGSAVRVISGSYSTTVPGSEGIVLDFNSTQIEIKFYKLGEAMQSEQHKITIDKKDVVPISPDKFVEIGIPKDLKIFEISNIEGYTVSKDETPKEGDPVIIRTDSQFRGQHSGPGEMLRNFDGSDWTSVKWPDGYQNGYSKKDLYLVRKILEQPKEKASAFQALIKELPEMKSKYLSQAHALVKSHNKATSMEIMGFAKKYALSFEELKSTFDDSGKNLSEVFA